MPATAEVKATVDRLGQAFEAFKQTNDRAEIERSLRGHTDALVDAKLDRLNREIDRLDRELKGVADAASRPALAGPTAPGDDAGRAHAFFEGYVRRGRDTDLARPELKALATDSDADGGYAVPEELDRAIDRRLRAISPVRQAATVVQIGSGDYKKLISDRGAVSGWVGETDPRAETDAPSFAEVAPPLGELYANPAATQTMLDDAFFDVAAWLADDLADEFAERESAAFVAGDGANKPRGFLDQPTSGTRDGVRAFGTLQYLATGTAGGFATEAPADRLFDLVYALKAGHRAEAGFMMTAATLGAVRKLKDGDGQYLWSPGLEAGQPAGLLGFPVVESAHMPEIAAGADAIAFGNFRRGYTITDRLGTRVLRDPYTNKPFVHFYTTKRVGGAVTDSEAIKLLRFAGS
ncbi:phage major capsid protein [Rhodothalassium salexigens]|nr:phage major capsid protein [Rhodothalassium salexigens]MBK5910057.1 phage major capsid protein [Rhodothalassium salexigens]